MTIQFTNRGPRSSGRGKVTSRMLNHVNLCFPAQYNKATQTSWLLLLKRELQNYKLFAFAIVSQQRPIL